MTFEAGFTEWNFFIATKATDLVEKIGLKNTKELVKKTFKDYEY